MSDRSKIELAGKYKRAATLTLAAGRDRERAEKGQPPLGWTGKSAVAGLYEALAHLSGLARGEGIIDVTVDPPADIKPPDRGETNRRPQSPARHARSYLPAGGRSIDAWLAQQQHFLIVDWDARGRIPSTAELHRHFGISRQLMSRNAIDRRWMGLLEARALEALPPAGR